MARDNAVACGRRQRLVVKRHRPSRARLPHRLQLLTLVSVLLVGAALPGARGQEKWEYKGDGTVVLADSHTRDARPRWSRTTSLRLRLHPLHHVAETSQEHDGKHQPHHDTASASSSEAGTQGGGCRCQTDTEMIRLLNRKEDLTTSWCQQQGMVHYSSCPEPSGLCSDCWDLYSRSSATMEMVHWASTSVMKTAQQLVQAAARDGDMRVSPLVEMIATRVSNIGGECGEGGDSLRRRACQEAHLLYLLHDIIHQQLP
mmetsp:Transcript_16920/g.47223  ORF Transcript_16920/g.47223 Transcript_16920/m.47223 type:complete len:258 (-) Transcript_16920:204-977(-)|eukprot:CAMPEP_0117654120 /NCGR_PEP_ID=MMETSP0804-20121206/3569_1 /TAXON_ID=1074897 /ORGANISM="Tetraselmis astigmatica, Strain CCMP880" /LENGTH=257 /DNA_ID=CAMNT_0005460369 /DNA_START=542 /DNA_END=1315 /DNA_ORIENTATION=+